MHVHYCFQFSVSMNFLKYKQMGLCSLCLLLCLFFHLVCFAQFWHAWFHFILSYFTLFYCYLLEAYLLSNERKKVGGFGWEGRWGVAGRRRWENHNQDRFLIKYLLSKKRKKEEKWERKHIVTVESWWGCGLAELQMQALLGENWRFCWRYSSIWVTSPKVTGCAEAR